MHCALGLGPRLQASDDDERARQKKQRGGQKRAGQKRGSRRRLRRRPDPSAGLSADHFPGINNEAAAGNLSDAATQPPELVDESPAPTPEVDGQAELPEANTAAISASLSGLAADQSLPRLHTDRQVMQAEQAIRSETQVAGRNALVHSAQTVTRAAAAAAAQPVTRAAAAQPVTRVPAAQPVTRAAVAQPVTRAAVAQPVTRAAAAQPVTTAAAIAPAEQPGPSGEPLLT